MLHETCLFSLMCSGFLRTGGVLMAMAVHPDLHLGVVSTKQVGRNLYLIPRPWNMMMMMMMVRIALAVVCEVGQVTEDRLFKS